MVIQAVYLIARKHKEEKGEEETDGILQSLFRSTPEIALIPPTRPYLSKLPLHPSRVTMETKSQLCEHLEDILDLIYRRVPTLFFVGGLEVMKIDSFRREEV